MTCFSFKKTKNLKKKTLDIVLINTFLFLMTIYIQMRASMLRLKRAFPTKLLKVIWDLTLASNTDRNQKKYLWKLVLEDTAWVGNRAGLIRTFKSSFPLWQATAKNAGCLCPNGSALCQTNPFSYGKETCHFYGLLERECTLPSCGDTDATLHGVSRPGSRNL